MAATVAALAGACAVVAVGISGAQARTAPHAIARAADVNPGGGCSDPEPGECAEDPKTHCPVKGPLQASVGEECVQIPAEVVNVKGKSPEGGCSNLEVIVVTTPPNRERFEAAWYSEIGLGTRWWQSPGEPGPIVNGAASYTVPAGKSAWSGAGGNGGPGVCEQGIPEKTFGAIGWALVEHNSGGEEPGGGRGGQPGHRPGGGSGGAAACHVPKLRRLTLVRAKTELKRHDCRLGRVRRAASSASNRGRVIGQTIRPGRVLAAGSKVGVTLGR